jgi:hypothetical protein
VSLPPGLGGLPPRPPTAPDPGAVTYGITPGQSQTFIGRYVIIFGDNGGVFIYNGTPGPGNPPVYSNTNAIEDPYGNGNIIPGITSYSASPYGAGSFAISMQEAALIIWYWNTVTSTWSAGYSLGVGGDWGLGIAQTINEEVFSPIAGQMSREMNALYFSLLSTVSASTAGLTFLAASGDQTGAQDFANIMLLQTFGIIILLPGLFWINNTVPVANQNAVIGCNASFGVPIGNYGAGSLPLQGSIIKCTDTFANPNSGTACILLSQGTGQGGGQRLSNFSLDCSTLPSGNNLHGIGVFNAVAAATFTDVTVYGGPSGVAGSLGGDCFHAISGGTQPPDLLTLIHNHFAGGSGWGATINGVADSYVTLNECTGNGLGGWNITNGNNSRYSFNKGEQSTGGPGWKITFATGFTGILHMLTNTCQDNFQDGMQVTGPGTGTLKVSDFAYDSDGQNGGAGGGGFAGMNIETFAGTVQLELLKGRVGASYPEYGLSITNLTGKVTIDNVDAAAITQGLNWDFSGTVVFGEYTFTPAGGVWYEVGAAGAPGFGAGWSNIGAGNVPVRFRRVPPNNIEIEGSAANATAANAAPIFTLPATPAGMRPTFQQIFALVENGTVYGNSLVVQTNGEVTPFANAGAGNYFLGSPSVGLD